MRVSFLMAVALGFSVVSVLAEGQALGVTASASPGFQVGSRGITGMPYSAEQVNETVQTLADGTHITQSNETTKLFRDSEGRTRTEHHPPPLPGASGASAPPIFVMIWDPVAGVTYNLNERTHTATRHALQPARAVSSSASKLTAASSQPAVTVAKSSALISNEVAQPNRPHTVREPLGTQVMEGLTVEGTRRTTTYPEGSVGNDRPFTVMSESWLSPELKMTVLSKTSDPRRGESTIKLFNISRSEPDPALFQVPSDYTIEDQPQRNN